MEWGENIPDFSTRYANTLEACVSAPFTASGGKYIYSGLVKKASVLFYLMVKRHPFKNGNKRIAITTLFVFLDQNDKWVKVTTEELYNFAKIVALSDPQKKEGTIEVIDAFLRTNISEVNK